MTVEGIELAGFEHHFLEVRKAIVKELWSRQFFIGVSVIDSLLYKSLVAPRVTDPIRHVLEMLRDHRLHYPGFVLYPVHSFGILAAGFWRHLAASTALLGLNDYGLILTPQTNSLEETVQILNQIARTLGLAQSVSEEQIIHWERSRQMSWLYRNPLLAVRIRSFPGDYYHNQFTLKAKLEFATSIIYMLHSLQEARTPTTDERAWSSRLINNSQTLDLEHYLAFYPRSRFSKFLESEAVPLDLRRPELADLCDLNVEVDATRWRRSTSTTRRITSIIRSIETGFFRHVALSSRRSNTSEARLYRKLSDSLRWFRRSFHSTRNQDEATVSLAIAFETLLTDHYGRGIAERIYENLDLCLKGVRGKRRMMQAVEHLYTARSEIVHKGRTDVTLDLTRAREPFVHSLCVLVSNIHRLNLNTGRPIEDFLRTR